MSKFKKGDFVVRVGDKQYITLDDYPVGRVLQIKTCVGTRDPSWGESYTTTTGERFVISDCDFELYEEEN